MRGRKRHYVKIEKPTTTNSEGEPSVAWSTLRHVWVKLVPLTSREYFQAAQIQSDVTHQVTANWDEFKDVTSDMRLKYGTRVFEILEPPRNVEERNREATFMVREVV